MNDETIHSRIAKFIINEVLPRSNKLKVKPEEFLEPWMGTLLVQFEQEGLTFRKQTREFLDYFIRRMTNPSLEPSDTVVRISLMLQVCKEYNAQS